MRAWEIVRAILFPPKCAVCGEILPLPENKYFSSSCLCPECAYLWERAKQESCPECLCASHMCLCSTGSGKLKGYKLPKLLTYTPSISNTQNKMIFAAKHKNDKRLTEFLASELSVSLCRYLKDEGIAPDSCIFSYVPRRKRAINTYGFDQSRRLSLEIGRICEGQHAELFSRRRGKEQKRLDASARSENIALSVGLCSSAQALIKGKVVVIVDDLVTTGATLGHAAMLLKRAGASRVVVASIARTEMEK